MAGFNVVHHEAWIVSSKSTYKAISGWVKDPVISVLGRPFCSSNQWNSSGSWLTCSFWGVSWRNPHLWVGTVLTPALLLHICSTSHWVSNAGQSLFEHPLNPPRWWAASNQWRKASLIFRCKILSCVDLYWPRSCLDHVTSGFSEELLDSLHNWTFVILAKMQKNPCVCILVFISTMRMCTLAYKLLQRFARNRSKWNEFRISTFWIELLK